MYARAYIEITTICNRSCSFCPGTTRPLRRMSLSEFDTVTDRLRGVTEYLYYHVMGEPLTHPDLPDFIRLAKGKGFKSAITTNGTLLSKRGRELIEAGVYKVNISVHSFEDGEDSSAHGAYLDQILDFADEASQSGVLTVLRLWNLDGHGEALGGNNARTLDYLMKALNPNGWLDESEADLCTHLCARRNHARSYRCACGNHPAGNNPFYPAAGDRTACGCGIFSGRCGTGGGQQLLRL